MLELDLVNMEDRNTLLFQKGNGEIVNSYEKWGIVCAKVPFNAGGKTKELAKRDWHDEQGEDTYIPSRLMFEAYDAEFELAYKGQELATNPFNLSLAFEKIDTFKKWISGNDTDSGSGAELKIYSPYSAIGRQGCYLKEISDEEPVVQTKYEQGNLYNENIVTFKVKFRVTDPMTNIILSDESDESNE